MPDLQFGTNTATMQVAVQVVSVEADWDDESGRAEVRVELRLWSSDPQAWVMVSKLRYWATILAEL